MSGPYRYLVPGGLAVLVFVVSVLFTSGSRCAEIDHLIEQARSDFDSIKGEAIADKPGEYEVAFAIPGASRCWIVADVERNGYLCSWEHDLGSAEGRSQFERSVEDTRSCVGASAVERIDRSVNHPDYYESVYFNTELNEVSVSLKDKNVLGKTLVFIGVDKLT